MSAKRRKSKLMGEKRLEEENEKRGRRLPKTVGNCQNVDRKEVGGSRGNGF